MMQERWSSILNIVESRGAVTVLELADLLKISESTIRRDLTALDRLGKLQKVHGGATALGREFVSDEYDVHTKSQICVEEKNAIARYAATLIQDEDFVFIDAGTSTEMLINYISSSKAAFVTNGILHAKKLVACGLKTYVIGGVIKPVTEAVVGADAVTNMKKYNFTKAFLGTNGIHVEFGYTTVDVEEAMMKIEAVNRSRTSFILADHTKFDKITAVTFAPIEKAQIITDSQVNKKYKDVTYIKEVSLE